VSLSDESVLFNEKILHRSCFHCSACNCGFAASDKYYERDGSPYCEVRYLLLADISQKYLTEFLLYRPKKRG
jgi:hypothetical protein